MDRKWDEVTYRRDCGRFQVLLFATVPIMLLKGCIRGWVEVKPGFAHGSLELFKVGLCQFSA
jgi:hypothetical protein